jgi:FtsP/CotA-like multicopper oxidase with cupredoxin domain
MKKRSLAASLAFTPALLLAALLAPGGAAAAGPISASSACSTVGTTVTCDIEAKTGTVTPAGAPAPITIWGFAPTGQPASLPGPTIIATTGDSVTVNLTNQLTVTTSILFDGQAMVPDLNGVTAGNSKTYTFTAGTPGTYLYEAGLIPGSQYQVAMGLYGALIVRPSASATQANENANSAFADEELVVLGEIDPKLNNAVTSPASFDLRDYSPKYFLINGEVYTGATAPITTTGGNTLLLRYLNAGIQHHSMGVLGLRQLVVNDDGNELLNPRLMVAESLAPGQSQDAIVVIPGPASSSPANYLVYDTAMGLNNTSTPGIGGMIRMISAAGTGAAVDTGPVTSAVTLAGSTLTAHITDNRSTDAVGSVVNAAEYYIDTLSGAATAFTISPGDPVDVTATVSASLTSGGHVIYVRGRDDAGNWGPVASTSFTIDAGGPATTGATVSPNSTNRTVNVALSATADDRISGGSNIAAAEYFFDIAGADGLGTAMTVSNVNANVASVNATIAFGSLPAGSGPHAVLIHSQDSTGAWGAYTPVPLMIDTTGPTTTAASATPSDGVTGLNSTNPSIRVSGSFLDATPSFVKTAEVFVGATGANGSGIPMAPTDGVFNSASEQGYADIPLNTIRLTPNSSHLYVHGKDSAGNWSSTFFEVLLSIDTTGPTTSALVLDPTTADAQAVTVSGSATDSATGNHNIAAAEFFVDSTDPTGTGTPMTVTSAAPTSAITGTIQGGTVAGLAIGTHTISVHSKDANGNWGARVNVTLTIDRTVPDTTPPTFTGITLNPSTIYAGTPTINLTVDGPNDGLTGSVVGGESWIGATPAEGSGTPFTGTGPIAPSINTASLTPGTYTVGVRVKDAAGLWSVGVHTATLTVQLDTIFINGFDTNLLGGWTSRSTATANRLDTNASAAVTGARGLRARGNQTNYVQYNFGTAANPATSTLDVRFNFRPNANATSGQDIFVAATSNAYSNRLIRVRYRRSGGVPQVQILVSGTNLTTGWTAINGGAANNVIEVLWKNNTAAAGAPNQGQLRLYVNGTLRSTRTVTSTLMIRTFRIGSVTGTGNSTREFFDNFKAKRSTTTPFGP